MKLVQLLLGLGASLILISASSEKECASTLTMIGMVKEQTGQALKENDLSLIHHYAFNALNTIEKSKAQLEACGCDYARKNLMESLENLKLSTRVTSLEGARIPLSRAMEYIKAAREALRQHEITHDRPFGQELLAVANSTLTQTQARRDPEEEKTLETRIEEALRNYEDSLNEVVESVPCGEALDFVRRIQIHSQTQLDRGDQSPAKKFFNSRMKEISEKALYRLRQCNH
ncbi:MAG: hypothetical protein P8Z38_03825 [Robiginitalea sp.]